MKIAISKWGNSLGLRIPSAIAHSLHLKSGDHVECEMKNGGFLIKKEMSTAQLFEDFYGKPFDQISEEDIGPGEEIDWGQDVGGEIL